MVPVKIMHDESLVSMSDAEQLLEMGVADAFNTACQERRVPACALAHFARKHGSCTAGCMVGETASCQRRDGISWTTCRG